MTKKQLARWWNVTGALVIIAALAICIGVRGVMDARDAKQEACSLKADLEAKDGDLTKAKVTLARKAAELARANAMLRVDQRDLEDLAKALEDCERGKGAASKAGPGRPAVYVVDPVINPAATAKQPERKRGCLGLL